jgi:hypothetical protein
MRRSTFSDAEKNERLVVRVCHRLAIIITRTNISSQSSVDCQHKQQQEQQQKQQRAASSNRTQDEQGSPYFQAG